MLAELAQDAQYQPPHGELDEAFWRQLLIWLFDRDWIGSSAVREGLGLLAYVLLGVVAVALALLVWGIVRRGRARRSQEAQPSGKPKRAQPTALDPFEEAERAWASGDGRAATSALYRGAIQTLDSRGLVRADPSKLASDYRSELGASPERTLWDRVVGPFYAAVFGGRALCDADFDAARTAAKALGGNQPAGGAP